MAPRITADERGSKRNKKKTACTRVNPRQKTIAGRGSARMNADREEGQIRVHPRQSAAGFSVAADQHGRTAILINTARGPVVDHAALYAALRDGIIAGAALDVTDPEPFPTDSPLLTLDNVIIAPHIASASVATRGKMARMAADNLIAGLRGERLPNCVNPEVYKPR
jgi:hypothetical protein